MRKNILVLSIAALGLSGLSACSSSYGESRYGEYAYEYGYEQNGACAQVVSACGYYIIPTYQIIETPPPVVTPPEPEIPVEPPVIVCPDGQYMMADGTCAIMMTEPEPPQYVPPISYPEPPYIPPTHYQPIRK